MAQHDKGGAGAPYKLEDKKRDADAAFLRAQRYHGELQEIYRFFTPFRQSTVERAGARGGGSEGEKRTDFLFDGTGPSAAFAFVSNMKADWMPAFEDFFALKNGPLYAADDKEQRQVQLDLVGQVVHGLTQRIRATATDEMFGDLFAGTGALNLVKGDRRFPIRGFSVPTSEIAIEPGPWGDIERVFWRRKFKLRELEVMWPKAAIGNNLASAIKADRNADVEVTQFTWWDAASDQYRLDVWTTHDTEQELWTERMRTSSWVTPRQFVVPGEAFGRGLAHLGLPFVKTVNKARELALRAAAFSLLGLWTRRDDRVFNPDTAVMAPGAFWKVSSNAGGTMGPAIQRLDVPHNFDVSTIVIKDEREQIRRVLLDDELPELTDRVRSPTEIAGRRRRYERNRGGATTRLAFELVTPFVQRSLDILSDLKMLGSDLKLDDMLTQAVVSAPAASAQRTDRVERMTSWLQIIAGLAGPQAMQLTAEIDKILPEIGRDLGVDEKFIRSKTESDHLKAIINDAVQAAMKAAKGAPPEPPPPKPAGPEQYLNGGF